LKNSQNIFNDIPFEKEPWAAFPKRSIQFRAGSKIQSFNKFSKESFTSTIDEFFQPQQRAPSNRPNRAPALRGSRSEILGPTTGSASCREAEPLEKFEIPDPKAIKNLKAQCERAFSASLEERVQYIPKEIDDAFASNLNQLNMLRDKSMSEVEFTRAVARCKTDSAIEGIMAETIELMLQLSDGQKAALNPEGLKAKIAQFKTDRNALIVEVRAATEEAERKPQQDEVPGRSGRARSTG
jgi:hypothetical protein